MTVDSRFFRHWLTKTLREADPALAVQERLHLRGSRLHAGKRSFDLERFAALHVLGAGKSATAMYEGVKACLMDRISGGLIVSIPEQRFNDRRVRFLPGSHPLPDRRSLEAGRAMVAYIRQRVKRDDLVIFLLSGGASSLMVYPRPGVNLAAKRSLTAKLLRSGAPIQEVNRVRRGLSLIKGGGLGRMIRPAAILPLVISDVGEAPLSDVGSGPILPARGDSSPLLLVSDARRVLQHGMAIARREIPRVHLLASSDRGESREAAKLYASLVREITSSRQPFAPPVLLLAGGELTVTVKGRGRGGRNQEFMLALLLELKNIVQPFFAASVGSDGRDGPTEAAGAWIDGRSLEKAHRLGLDPAKFLAANDSHTFFRRLRQLVVTGPTRLNVADLRFIHVGKS